MGTISEGHARALLAIAGREQEALARKVVSRGLSVRETENLVNDLLHPKAKAPRKPSTDRDVQRLGEELSDRLGTTVELRPGKKGSGKLVISYASLEHLDELIEKLRA